MNLSGLKQDWEDLAALDPLWAILSDPRYQHQNWDLGAFFLTGEHEIEGLVATARGLAYPKIWHRSLDFGCGVGRLTRALARYFEECFGVDISETMIGLAGQMNGSVPNCRFFRHVEPNLKIFPENHFDLVYTSIVLQHLPKPEWIRSYIQEFLRVLAPGGLLVFQLPSWIRLRNRVQPRRRLYRFLRILGLDRRFLYEKLGLVPIVMNFIPEEEVVAYLRERSGRILLVEADSSAPPGVKSRRYYLTKP